LTGSDAGQWYERADGASNFDRGKPSVSLFAVGPARPRQMVERVKRQVKFVPAAKSLEDAFALATVVLSRAPRRARLHGFVDLLQLRFTKNDTSLLHPGWPYNRFDVARRIRTVRRVPRPSLS